VTTRTNSVTEFVVPIGNVHYCTSPWLRVKKAVIRRDSRYNMT
jgi:hypothetical protein